MKTFFEKPTSAFTFAYCIAQNELEYVLKEPVSSFFYASSYSRDIFFKTTYSYWDAAEIERSSSWKRRCTKTKHHLMKKVHPIV